MSLPLSLCPLGVGDLLDLTVLRLQMFHRGAEGGDALPCLPELLRWPLPDLLGGATKDAAPLAFQAAEQADNAQALQGGHKQHAYCYSPRNTSWRC